MKFTLWNEWGYNIQLFLLYTFTSTAFRGIWDQHILSLYVYLITHGSNSSVGLITGITGIAQLICTFGTATIGDKISRNLILLCGTGLGVIGIMMSIYAIVIGHYTLLLICMILWGFYWATTNPTLDAMVADLIEQGNRSKVYSTVATVRFIGRSFGPLVSIILFLLIGDNWTIPECKFVMISGLVLFLLPTLLLAMFHPSEPEDILPKSQPVETPHESTPTTPKSPDIQHILDSSPIYFSCFPSLLYVPSMIAITDVISGLASGMTIKFFPIFFANDLHLSPIEVSAVIMITALVLSGSTNIAQRASKYLGRIYVTIICKLLGLSFFSLLLVVYYSQTPTWATNFKLYSKSKTLLVLILYVLRTTLMNSAAPLTKSSIMDTVPSSQRIRWSSLESINNLTWSGSAVVGGILIDRYGIETNFILTIIMQFSSLFPLFYIAHLVPDENNATNMSKYLLAAVDYWKGLWLRRSGSEDHIYSMVNMNSETDIDGEDNQEESMS